MNITEMKDMVRTEEFKHEYNYLQKAISKRDYIKPIVDAYHYKVMEEINMRHIETGEKIRDSELAYRSDDATLEKYYVRIEEEKYKAGFTNQKDYCPLLMSMHTVLSSKMRLIDLCKVGLGFDSRDCSCFGKLNECIDLLCGLYVTVQMESVA